MKRVVPAALAVVICACATPQAKPAEPKAEQQRITNLGYYDVGACEVKPPAVPDVANPEVLIGVLVAARPHVMECLVDPRNRGPEKNTMVTVDSTLVQSGVEHKVGGTNLTPTGTACIQDALAKFTGALPNLKAPAAATSPAAAAKGKKPPAPAAPAAPTAPAAAAPLTGHVEFQHVQGINPSVNLGANEANDIVGVIRLAEPGWCDCFGPWKSAPPHALKATVKVNRPAPPPEDKSKKKEEKKKDAVAAAPAPLEPVNPSEVSFEPTNDANADQVASCLKGKIQALKFKPPAGEYISLPLPMRFVHSGEEQPLGGGSGPDLQFTQYDLLRNQRAAHTAIAVGTRSPAVTAYDSAVKLYKDTANSPKGPAVTVKELQDKCGALLKSDDKVIDAIKAQLSVEKATDDFAAAQLEKDKAWQDAKTATGEKLAEAQKDVATWEQTRKADEAACPKVKYDEPKAAPKAKH